MGKILFGIDEKSLFYGIYNDYSRGQTATVHTPINQSADPEKWHRDIISVLEQDAGLDVNSLPATLVDSCLRKTTSQADSILKNFYVFRNIAFDGKPLKTNRAFAIYVKEETSRFITDRNGKSVPNTHLGRLKLHYPTTLKYIQDGYNIDNKKVLNDILSQNGGFAYIVRALEVDVEASYLNFITSIVGLEGVPLSNVFKRQKGVGEKLLLSSAGNSYRGTLNVQSTIEEVDSSEIIKNADGAVDFEAINQARAKNGKRGEKYVFDNLSKIMGVEIISSYHTSEEYPTSPYDIEYYCVDGMRKKYVEVKSTSGNKKVFNMSAGEMKFMDKYNEDYALVLVTRVNDSMPKVDVYNRHNILKMRKTYPTIRFFA